MVLEDFDSTPVMEWLFGPGWAQGWLLHPLTLVILLAVLLLAGYVTVRLLQSWPLVVSRRAGGWVGGLAVAGLLFVLALVLLWGLDLGPSPTEAEKAKAEAKVQDPAKEAAPQRVSTRTIVEQLVKPVDTAGTALLGPGWLEGAVFHWVAILISMLAAVFGIGWLLTAVVHGPIDAVVRCGLTLADAVLDLMRTSPRRVLALAWLAIRDSIRRRVVVVFAVFLALVAFAGWFINPTSDQPGRLYIQFVLTSTGYLVLILAWVLSSVSLPGDFRDRTIYTLVTKPVRPNEIVLGRLLGFLAVGTLLLGSMAAISYVFTVRGLQHAHQLTAENLRKETLPGGRGTVQKGLTSLAQGHQHEVTIDAAVEALVEAKQGHWHELQIDASGPAPVYRLGPPQGMLVARVPIYGALRFRDPTGRDVDRGINVGDEWSYRSFVQGDTRAAAVWRFQGITEEMFPQEMFPDGIPLEMTIEVFRSHKGDVGKGVLGALWVRNSDTGETFDVRDFRAKSRVTDVQWLPRQWRDRKNPARKVDFFRDVVSGDGRFEIGVQCVDRGQYFGAAQPDLYIRARDASFALNLAKGFLGLGLQMAIVLAIGVMFSTFLSAPVAMIATLAMIIGGLFSDYVFSIATGTILGGGPFESFTRLMNQANLVEELAPGLQTTAVQMSDKVMQYVFWVLSPMLPAFQKFDLVDYVAFGFDVQGMVFWKCVFRAVAVVLPMTAAGYFFLKLREVAK